MLNILNLVVYLPIPFSLLSIYNLCTILEKFDIKNLVGFTRWNLLFPFGCFQDYIIITDSQKINLPKNININVIWINR